MSQLQEQMSQSTGSSLLDSIISQTSLTPEDEGYEAARLGISAFIEEMLKPVHAGEKVRKAAVDHMIAEIDRRLAQAECHLARKLRVCDAAHAIGPEKSSHRSLLLSS